FHDLQTAASGTDARSAATQAQFLINTLSPADSQPVPAYQQGRAAASDQIGAPLERFLKLPNPSATPAAPDLQTTFTTQPIGASTPAAMVQSAWLTPSAGPSLLEDDKAQLRITPQSGSVVTLPFHGGGSALAADWSNDFNVDLVLAGKNGLRFVQQQPAGKFVDVTAQTKLPPAILSAAYTDAWASDIDTDGDLDIILGAKSGPPTVLRNNADGTFTAIHPFPGLTTGLQNWAWADLDQDGLPDAVILDAQGHLSVYENRRSGEFAPWPLPAAVGPTAAVAVADADRDGRPDVTALGADGAIRRVSRTDSAWTVAELARWANTPTDGSARLIWQDMDNNGGMDLIATGSTGTQVWLSDAANVLKPLAPLDTRNVSVEIPAAGGRLNLVGIAPSGQSVRLVNTGKKSYHWQDVRLRSQLTHDRRNNAYGIGGEIQLRAGLLYEKQIVSSPVTHFGLGDYARADYVRIFWPNGSPQGEFEFAANSVFSPLERLKGSCPWLFADDGHGMKFVTDLIWRSPLGLRINAQNTAGVAMTRDRVRIAGSQLQPINGSLNLNVTAELWETHFFDYFSLLTVDHPAGTDVYTDERFAIPPPPLTLRALTPPQPVLRAVDDRGQDVTEFVKARDGRYLDTFGRGAYQGITRDHYVEVDLGKAPSEAHPWLVAEGWIHPTDSSLNLALSQGQHIAPHDLSLEIPDAHGVWRTARPHLGFPAGKNKTILIDLAGLFQPGQERRLRLRTNLEIYWDFLGSATELPASTLKVQRLSPTVADLRDRGYSV
nr:CRTAC1 family protein [Armatimonadota bacterium]